MYRNYILLNGQSAVENLHYAFKAIIEKFTLKCKTFHIVLNNEK